MVKIEWRNSDRQRKLDELCREVLKDFVGRELTPTLLVDAEVHLRFALDEAVRAGTYVPPDGLRVSRVELGRDMRIKVFFDKVSDVTARFVAVGSEIDPQEGES